MGSAVHLRRVGGSTRMAAAAAVWLSAPRDALAHHLLHGRGQGPEVVLGQMAQDAHGQSQEGLLLIEAAEALLGREAAEALLGREPAEAFLGR